jgi:hypothetical protein
MQQCNCRATPKAVGAALQKFCGLAPLLLSFPAKSPAKP